MMKKVTLIPGDGIGPEIVESVKKVFKAAGVQIEWEEALAGETAYAKLGELLPISTLESIKRNKIALKAPLTTPVGKGFRSVNVQLRKELDLYANIRPIRTIEGVNTPLKSNKPIDMVIVRENTEDLYAGVEHMVGSDAAESIKIITKKGSERIAKIAVRTLLQRKRSDYRLTIVHKANIMKLTDGLFLETATKIANDFGGINVDDRIIDNMCMQLVQRPETFNVILAPNLYGDILSDLCASLIGGLGVAPGANIGDDYEVYEAIHGTAPDIAGKGLANPTSLLLSATMMLRSRHIDDFNNADRIEIAILKTIKEGKFVTGDLGGKASTTEFTDAIISNL
ncbi:MAG: isocitrate/isopropylmalate dehydrogenase family protein [Nanoarchaeota archaeon]